MQNNIVFFRTGRNRQGWDNPAEMEQRQLLLESARAWMDLAPIAAGTEPATVEVGQPTRLLIQCTLPGMIKPVICLICEVWSEPCLSCVWSDEMHECDLKNPQTCFLIVRYLLSSTSKWWLWTNVRVVDKWADCPLYKSSPECHRELEDVT